MTIRVESTVSGESGAPSCAARWNWTTSRSWRSTTSPTPGLAHLWDFDSTDGRRGARVGFGDGVITVDGSPIKVLSSPDPGTIDWGELGSDIVIESTGKFRAEDAAMHLKGGTRKVLLSAPGRRPGAARQPAQGPAARA